MLIDFDFQEELKNPNNKLLNLSLIFENLVFCTFNMSLKIFPNKYSRHNDFQV